MGKFGFIVHMVSLPDNIGIFHIFVLSVNDTKARRKCSSGSGFDFNPDFGFQLGFESNLGSKLDFDPDSD